MSQEFKTPMELNEGEPFIVTLERVPYVTKHKHGGHPAGTKCFAQRKNPPEFNIILEFEDGSTIELPGHYHLEGYERAGESLVDIEDRRCFAHIAYSGGRSWPTRYKREPVI
jgi:hypothetical protein